MVFKKNKKDYFYVNKGKKVNTKFDKTETGHLIPFFTQVKWKRFLLLRHIRSSTSFSGLWRFLQIFTHWFDWLKNSWQSISSIHESCYSLFGFWVLCDLHVLGFFLQNILFLVLCNLHMENFIYFEWNSGTKFDVVSVSWILL